MENQGIAKQVARWVALAALFVIPIAPLLIANSFFFPFITGKAFFFRSMVEIAFVAWVLLAFLDKEYRPRFSWTGVAVLAFVAWMFIADLFAVNVAKAFWSNFERSEGWVLLIHLAAFFFAASSILRVEKKWRAWFLTSLGFAVLVSVYGILQQIGFLAIHQGSTRIDATFGNSAYFAIYLLFNTFLALWLAFTEKRPWLKWSLIGFAIVEAFLIFLTETRGTVLGLLGGLVLAGLLMAITGNKRAKQWGAWGAIVVIVISGGLYLARHTSFVQGNHVLQRVTSITLASGQTRFTIWSMAFEGVLERPIVGWGQEGFNYVFNTFYQPSLYAQEPWFDRAHNAFIDWLVEGGIPAFLLYVSLWVTGFWYLWTRSELSRPERIALTAALAGYACHNLFVFDNLYSYVYFFAILAFIDSQVGKPFARFSNAPELSDKDGMAYGLPAAAIAIVLMIWVINVPGITDATELITAITPGNPQAQLATFENLVKNPSYPGVQEIREQLVAFASSISQDPQASSALKQSVETLAIQQMGDQVKQYPLDARERLQLAYAYNAAGDLPDALTQIDAAAALSPGKEDIWVQKGLTLWEMGSSTAAQAAFDHAYALGAGQFPQLAEYAAAGDYAAGAAGQGSAILMQSFGTTTVDSDILAEGYYRGKDWPQLIRLWQLRANKPNASINTEFGLAAAYYAAGEKQQAIAQVQKIMKEYPQADQAGQQAIQQIQSGTVGQ